MSFILRNHFDYVLAKKVQERDISQNPFVFPGKDSFCRLVGRRSKIFQASFVYCRDNAEPVRCADNVLWSKTNELGDEKYNFRTGSNIVTDMLCPDDVIFICKLKMEKLLFVAAAKDSWICKLLQWFFDIKPFRNFFVLNRILNSNHFYARESDALAMLKYVEAE